MSDDARNQDSAAGAKGRRAGKLAAETRASLRSSGRPRAPRSPTRQAPAAITLRPYERLVEMRRELYRAIPAGKHGLTAREVLQLDSAEIARGAHALSWPGTAVALMRAYRDAGFQAWAYQFGIGDDLPAAVTVVELNGRRSIQDAFLNEECDLDLLDVLDRLRGERKAPWRAEAADRKRLADGASMGAAEYRKVTLAAGAKHSFPRLRALGLGADHHVLMLSPKALFDGETIHTDPASMPLIQEWIERRGGVLLSEESAQERRRSMAQKPSQQPPPPEQAAAEFEVSAQKFTQERRQWLAERLALQEKLDTAEYQATLADARQRAALTRIQQLTAEVARSEAELASSDEVCTRYAEQIKTLQARASEWEAQQSQVGAAAQQVAAEAAARETASQQALNETRAAAEQAAAEAAAREVALQQALNEARAAAEQAAAEAAAREAALQQALNEARAATEQAAAEAAAREAALQQALNEAGAVAEQATADAAARGAALQQALNDAGAAAAQAAADAAAREAALQQALNEAVATCEQAAAALATREAALQQGLSEAGAAAERAAIEAAAREAALQQALSEAGRAAADIALREAALQQKVSELAQAIADVEVRRQDLEAALEASQQRRKHLAEENEELVELARQTAAELATLTPGENGGAAAHTPVDAAARALRDARKAAGMMQASLTRERLLQNEKSQLEQERESMRGELVHLSAVVNRSRYLRWRRRLLQWLTGRRQ
ncbi:MAG: hypothetical protein AB7T59_19485 [Hyphomonadaceae bacterium]